MGDELKAMGQIQEAMGELEEDEARRVLLWANDKYGDGLVVPPPRSGGAGNGAGGADLNGGDESSGKDPAKFERISDLMDAAAPSTGVEHVLVGAYWFQVVGGNEDFTGYEVNAKLKDLGHGAKNITDSFTSLISKKPPLARQVQKSGKSRQARKRYRLTTEGIRAVERMLKGGDEG